MTSPARLSIQILLRQHLRQALCAHGNGPPNPTLILSDLALGRHSAQTLGMASCSATARAVRQLSPVTKWQVMPMRCSAAITPLASAFKGSLMASTPEMWPPMATMMHVQQSLCKQRRCLELGNNDDEDQHTWLKGSAPQNLSLHRDRDLRSFHCHLSGHLMSVCKTAWMPQAANAVSACTKFQPSVTDSALHTKPRYRGGVQSTFAQLMISLLLINFAIKIPPCLACTRPPTC